jgi:hypothetical protein
MAEAESLLAGKVLAHNHFLARRSLVELGLALRLPALVEEQCGKLASFYERSGRPIGDTMPLADFLVRRGRVLACAAQPALARHGRRGASSSRLVHPRRSRAPAPRTRGSIGAAAGVEPDEMRFESYLKSGATFGITLI